MKHKLLKRLALTAIVLLIATPIKSFASNIESSQEVSFSQSLVKEVKNDEDPLEQEEIKKILNTFGKETFLRYEINDSDTLTLYFETTDQNLVKAEAYEIEDYKETRETQYYTTGNQTSNQYQAPKLTSDLQEAYKNGKVTEHLITYDTGILRSFINTDGSLSHTNNTGKSYVIEHNGEELEVSMHFADHKVFLSPQIDPYNGGEARWTGGTLALSTWINAAGFKTDSGKTISLSDLQSLPVNGEVTFIDNISDYNRWAGSALSVPTENSIDGLLYITMTKLDDSANPLYTWNKFTLIELETYTASYYSWSETENFRASWSVNIPLESDKPEIPTSPNVPSETENPDLPPIPQNPKQPETPTYSVNSKKSVPITPLDSISQTKGIESEMQRNNGAALPETGTRDTLHLEWIGGAFLGTIGLTVYIQKRKSQ